MTSTPAPTRRTTTLRRLTRTTVALVAAFGLAMTLSPADAAPKRRAAKIGDIATRSTCQNLNIVGHRGTRDVATENTLPAFIHAYRHGATSIELDVRHTRDGVPVVMHDKRVNRTTNGRGHVRALPYAKVYRLRTPSGHRVPTLARILSFAKKHGVRVQMELKEQNSTKQLRRLNALLGAYGMRKRTTVISVHQGVLWRFHSIDARPTFGLLTSRKVRNPTWHKKTYADWVLYRWAVASPAEVDRLHSVGLKVGVWTNNTPRSWQRFAGRDRGRVDAVTTDRITAMRRWCTR